MGGRRSLLMVAAANGVIVAAALLMSGCSRESAATIESNSVSVVTATAKTLPRTKATTAPPLAGASVTAAKRMTPHKNFVDPPLPLELREDGGLTPLPPRPAVTPGGGQPSI